MAISFLYPIQRSDIFQKKYSQITTVFKNEARFQIKAIRILKRHPENQKLSIILTNQDRITPLYSNAISHETRPYNCIAKG